LGGRNRCARLADLFCRKTRPHEQLSFHVRIGVGGTSDKVADQISDAVLDAILAQDKTSRVAAETLVKDNMVVLAGEITTGARVNFSEVVRKTVKRIVTTIRPSASIPTHAP